jgi:hypothetical protein
MLIVVASLEADAVRATVNATVAVAAATASVMAIRHRLLLVMSLLSSGVYKTPASGAEGGRLAPIPRQMRPWCAPGTGPETAGCCDAKGASVPHESGGVN